MRRIKDLISSLKGGAPIYTVNDGRPIDEVAIRYKDFFFMIDFDAESGEPTGDFGWSEGQPMTHIPIREFWTAVRPEATKKRKDD